jgi:cephalosporin hydroxylase
MVAEQAIRRGAIQKAGELAPLLRRLHRRSPRAVVEIGTYRGGTLWAWCQVAADDALLVSVDLPGGPFGGGYGAADIPRLESFCRGRQRLLCLRRDSHDPVTVALVRAALAGRAVDFLIIDGDHSFHGVSQDFELWSPLVAGGLIAFHDIVFNPTGRGGEVTRYWRNMIRPYHVTEELVEHRADGRMRSWGGIGLVHVPPR